MTDLTGPSLEPQHRDLADKIEELQERTDRAEALVEDAINDNERLRDELDCCAKALREIALAAEEAP